MINHKLYKQNILETYLGMVNFDCKDSEYLLIKLPYLEQIFIS